MFGVCRTSAQPPGVIFLSCDRRHRYTSSCVPDSVVSNGHQLNPQIPWDSLRDDRHCFTIPALHYLGCANYRIAPITILQTWYKVFRAPTMRQKIDGRVFLLIKTHKAKFSEILELEVNIKYRGGFFYGHQFHSTVDID